MFQRLREQDGNRKEGPHVGETDNQLRSRASGFKLLIGFKKLLCAAVCRMKNRERKSRERRLPARRAASACTPQGEYRGFNN